MPLAGLSLGSNLGDRLANLHGAVNSLNDIQAGDHLLVSSIYETDPIGCKPGAPAFLNAVIEIETDIEPQSLLGKLKEIETAMGRQPIHEVNSPREIDIDILYYGDLVLKTGNLEIPHPRMKDREFVLRPLADIRPDLVSPVLPLESDEVRITQHVLAAD